MNAGDFRHRVTIQAPVETATDRGGFTTGLPRVIALRVPACCEPLSGSELERQMQIDPRLRWRVRLRYAAGVRAEQTVIYHALEGDRVLEIVRPPVLDEQARTLDLFCSEAA